jgi:hypothetical protein
MAKLSSKYWTWELPHVMKWSERGAHIQYKPNPIIHKNTRIITIGSCFAQELAEAMERLHLNGTMHPGGLYYNTSSIRQEFERIFKCENGKLEEPFWKVEQGYIHPYKSYTKFFDTPEKLEKWSNELDKQADEIFQSAELFVITLGLIEAWRDGKTGRVYRQIPPPSVIEEKGIYFYRLTVGDMISDLERIYQIIKTKTQAKLLLTVSPVPLHATMTDSDIRIANNESKSRIRAAVSEFIEAHPDVMYFHSYEIVATAERSSDFMLEDGRHVQRRGVDYILNQFLRMYSGSDVEVEEIDTSWLSAPEKLAAKPKNNYQRMATKLWKKIFRKTK